MTEPLARRQMVPTNWDPALLPRLADVRPDYIYGSLPSETTLRAAVDLPAVTEEVVEDQVAIAADMGIGFIYVMNATSGTGELTEHGRYEILQRCEWLSGMGAKGIVVANPFVMELVRHWYPQLELHVSVLAEVESVNVARYFDGIGASVIHLAPNLNRMIPLLRDIRKAVTCRLSVLVNEGCVFQCPIRRYHAHIMSNSAERLATGTYADFPYYSCSKWKGADPAEVVRAPWIRPEDVPVYEELGIDHIKIAGREKMGDGPQSHTDWIVNCVESYAEGRATDIARLLIALEPPMGIDGQDAADYRISIDSSKLDGFLDYFVKGNCDTQCYRCGWCGEFAKKAVTAHGDRDGYVGGLITTIERIRIGDYRSRSGL